MIVNATSLNALFTSLRTHFQSGFDSAESAWEQVAMLIPSESKQNDYAWLGQFPALRKWIGSKQIKNLKNFKYNLPNEDFESTVEVNRNDIADDNVGVYAPMAQMSGYSAKTFPDQYVFSLLGKGFSEKCFDGKAYFASDHPVGKGTVSNLGSGSATPWFLMDTSKPVKPLIYQQRQKPTFVRMDDPQSPNVFLNKTFLYGVEARAAFGFSFWQLAYGSKATLDATAYGSARAAMAAFCDDESRPLNIKPDLLVVPPALEAAARAILVNERAADGSTNTWYGTAKLLVAPWLS